MATLNENIARAKADFKAIKGELVNKGASIPSGTPTSQYANIIKEMSTGSSEEAYEQGRQDVIAESKYIEKSATGKVISLTDVSEVSHKVKVVGVGNEVDVLDNILRQPYYQNKLTSGGVTWAVNDDGSVSAVGTSTAVSNFQMATSLPLESGKTYTFSTGSTNVTVLVTYKVNGSTKYLTATTEEVNLAWGDGYELVSFGIRVLSGVTVDEVVCPVIYESGTKQTITATPEGTEISSLCPNMNFFADEDITVDYYSSFGMQTEYDRFWDGLQQNGARTYYPYSFCGEGWNDNTFRPKYDIVPTGIARQLIFRTNITDLVALLDKCGVSIDISHATGFDYGFGNNYKLTTAPIVDLSNCTSAKWLYEGCAELVHAGFVSSEKLVFENRCFYNCLKLTHVIFSGIIASDINLQWSKLLDEESLVSISVALCDLVFSGFGDGWGSRTLTLSPESIARLKELPYPPDDLNPEGSPYAEDGASCYDVIVGRKGWNIA